LLHFKRARSQIPFENSQVSQYRFEMSRTKHWSEGALREPLTVAHEGKDYSGYYQTGRGIVRVTYDFDTKSTQTRTHPEVTARILLRELVRASLNQ
jgi:hypothetical protein